MNTISIIMKKVFFSVPPANDYDMLMGLMGPACSVLGGSWSISRADHQQLPALAASSIYIYFQQRHKKINRTIAFYGV